MRYLLNSASTFIVFVALTFVASTFVANAQEDIKAVQLYSQDELIRMIENNEHLDRVVIDKC